MLMSCLARGAWLTHANTLCAVHGFSLRVQLHSLGVTDTNIHINNSENATRIRLPRASVLGNNFI